MKITPHDPNAAIIELAESIHRFRQTYTEADRLLREHCELVSLSDPSVEREITDACDELREEHAEELREVEADLEAMEKERDDYASDLRKAEEEIDDLKARIEELENAADQ